MNKKNIIIIIVLLVITNMITYAVFSGKETVLSEKKASTTVATAEGLKVKSNDIYDSWKESGSSDSKLNTILNIVDEHVLELEYGDNKEVNEEIEKRKEQAISYYESQNNTLDDLLEGANMTKEEWETMMNVQVQKEYAAVDYVKTTISDAQVKDAHKADVPKYKTSRILFKVSADPEVAINELEEDARKEAEAVSEKLNKELKDAKDPEEVFAKYAKEYSDDEDTKDKGGDIGYSNTESEEYTAAADKLAVGEHTTKPVKTNYGYEIILKTDQPEPKDLSDEKVVDEYKEQIAEEMIEEKAQYATMALVELRAKYDFVIEDNEIDADYQITINNTEQSLEETE